MSPLDFFAVIAVFFLLDFLIRLLSPDRSMILEKKIDLLKKDHDQLKGAYERTVHRMQDHIDTETQASLKNFTAKIDEYFENDFEITTCYIQMIDGDVILKIGDEEIVHEVRLSSKYGETLEMNEFLEQAKAEWKAKKDKK